MVQERIAHSVLVLWRRGEVFKISTEPWNTAAVDTLKADGGKMIVLGEYGNVIVAGRGELHRENVYQSSGQNASLGPLRGLKVIGNSAYAVGMRRQIFRRTGPRVWTSMAGGLTPYPGASDTGVEALDGFSETELYVVGWGGEIWTSDGVAWTQAPSATNLILTTVCCAPDRQVYACGQNGLILKGRAQQWQIVDTGEMRHDIWSSAWFNGALYVATFRGLWRLTGDEFAPVATGDIPATTFYSLSACDDSLWSIGAKDVVRFDGESWYRIE